MNKPVTAVLVELPKKITETVWTKPAGYVDNRWLHERILNINQHKIEYRGNRGQAFQGKTKIIPGVFLFDEEQTLGLKIEKVDTVDYTFYGVIPLEERPNGTLCCVDWFELGEQK